MTHRTLLFTLIFAGLFSGAVTAAPQDPASGGLEQQLMARFATTKFEKSRIVKAGAVLLVQKEGIGAISPNGGFGMGRLGGSDLAYPNNYKSGTIRHDPKAMFLASSGSIRDLEPNERVYVLKIEVKDASILIGVQSCGTCDPKLPDPEHVPARANVSFQLGKPYLAAATPAQVEEIIGHVFATADGASTPQSPDSASAPPAVQQQPAAPMAPLAPIAPPPPPPGVDSPAVSAGPPAEVKIGQTPAQVTAAFGQPLQIFNLGAKVVYKYKSLKVTFVNGKVSDVE